MHAASPQITFALLFCFLLHAQKYACAINGATKTWDPGPGIGWDWPWHMALLLSRSLILSTASGYKQKRRDVYCFIDHILYCLLTFH